MPWKFTKLVFCGVAVRRRTLYVITLITSVAAVPLLTWAILAWDQAKIFPPQRTAYGIAATIFVLLALNGWRHILRREVFLYWEEARFIWPLALLTLIFATWLASSVGQQFPPATWTTHPDEMPLALPCLLASPLFIVTLWRWIRLPHNERRYEYPEENEDDKDGKPPAGAPPANTGQNPPGQNPAAPISPPPSG